MITIIPSGRLGNHLFQFAFGRAISRKLKTDFIFNTTELEEYFELSHYNNPVRKKLRRFRYMLSLKFQKYVTLDLNKDTKPINIINAVSNNQILYGYFQSTEFFIGYEHFLRKELKIKTHFYHNYLSKYSKLFNDQVICIGIRLSEYFTWRINEIDGNTPELNADYYKKCLSLIPDVKTKKIIIISENIESAKQFLNIEDAIYMTSSIDQFISLTLSDYLIIANSSFLWWGAWLNAKSGKVVYAPKYWLGHKVKREYPQNILPLDWVQVEV